MGESKALKPVTAWTLQRYASESRSLANSALMTAPVVLVYEVGLLMLGDRGVRNAADALIDRVILDKVVMALGRPGALCLNLLVLGAFLWLALRAAPRRATPLGLLVPVILESTLYACLLGPALMMIARRMMAAPLPTGRWEGVVLSLGAGFYEELVFRLAAIGGMSLMLNRVFGVTSGWAVFALLIVSGVGFSLFHHAGLGAERFTIPVFVMRSVAGVLLGAVFILRGFGVVCYTHVIYDLLCVHAG